MPALGAFLAVCPPASVHLPTSPAVPHPQPTTPLLPQPGLSISWLCL